MKNPFTPEERTLFLKRLELEHYSKPGILSKTPEAIKVLLSQDEFKISEYEDLVWLLCYISSNPTYEKVLWELYLKHNEKLVKFQAQMGVVIKRADG